VEKREFAESNEGTKITRERGERGNPGESSLAQKIARKGKTYDMPEKIKFVVRRWSQLFLDKLFRLFYSEEADGGTLQGSLRNKRARTGHLTPEEDLNEKINDGESNLYAVEGASGSQHRVGASLR